MAVFAAADEAAVAASLPSIGATITSSACDSRNCDLKFGAWDDSTRALRGERRGNDGYVSSMIGWLAVPRDGTFRRFFRAAALLEPRLLGGMASARIAIVRMLRNL